ncbi:MAG: methylated-DNA--[protein]-cysteine S-methyltransferase [Fimbriimonadaceae bacterium]|nr:methylated-DNA--[protein]-cysteine S-methyltransferase [Chitinophagales bacterium]
MIQVYTLTFLSPLGFIKINGTENHITAVNFTEENDPHTAELPEILLQCKMQLQEYFAGKRKTFELTLAPDGTEFQKKVWQQLLTIQYGNTSSYAQVATQIGDIKGIRAVGAANGRNPIAVIIPCHRVIGADGKLVGYAGELWRKQWLLELEEKKAKGILRLF